MIVVNESTNKKNINNLLKYLLGIFMKPNIVNGITAHTKKNFRSCVAKISGINQRA
ncbi:uncharacterized protein METZ01_LOCUS405973 [marine metagenome]|uniref:Uncharacterized protein n=1 Tax=marine metagenome TaxID=408172 RepID=A0A382W300_9ZZZZ